MNIRMKRRVTQDVRSGATQTKPNGGHSQKSTILLLSDKSVACVSIHFPSESGPDKEASFLTTSVE